ncbi:ABC-2 type transporter-domain-containing protein [Xylaria nigripes]|nr:ABC-2 type transporter-domain-containing protein [Xylaria nigripes]
MITAELPTRLLAPFCSSCLSYFIPGFQSGPSHTKYQQLMILITELFALSLSQLLAAVSPSAFVSSQCDPFLIITFALFCGGTIPYPQMPGFWKAWLYQLDPLTRLISGAVTTASSQAHNYLVNNNTNSCKYCAYSIGDESYETFQYSFNAFVASNTVIVLIATRFLN